MINLNRDIIVKIIGNSIIVVVIFLFLFTITFTFLEVSGLSQKINNKLTKRTVKEIVRTGNKLILTNYYGMKLDFDPYEKFTVQHLHPYYFFSLPWLPADIKKDNNNFVTVNSDGFRNSLRIGNRDKAVLLGGSTAFGHFSSSDRKTLASELTRRLPYYFVNRNAPSWNSHQELVALAKYIKPYKLSISFSVANDISSFCYNKSWKYPIKDVMESFDRVARYFNDVRGEVLNSAEDVMLEMKSNSIYGRLRNMFERVFPDTFKMLKILRARIETIKSDNKISKKIYQKENPQVSVKTAKNESRINSIHTNNAAYSSESENMDGIDSIYECEGKEDLLVKSILNNQKSMRQLSNGRGASHWLVVQPILELHSNFDSGNKNVVRFKKKVINKIMESDFCEINCLDLSNFFNNVKPENIIFDSTIPEHWKKAIFVDNVHIVDNGISMIAEKITQEINEQREIGGPPE